MSKSFHFIRRARVACAALMSGLVVLLLAALAACGGSSSDDVPTTTAAAREDAPASLGFDWPREVIVRSGSTAAALVSFEATPEHLALFYAVAGDVRFAAASPDARLVNNKGRVYETLSNIPVGAPEGVFLGILVAEPYLSGAPELSLQLRSLTDESGQLVPLDLDLPVATRSEPDGPVDFVEGGRYGHDDGIRIADATGGVAGPPAPTRTQALVVRGGKAASVYAEIDSTGVARVVSKEEFGFKAQLPPDFPWPEKRALLIQSLPFIALISLALVACNEGEDSSSTRDPEVQDAIDAAVSIARGDGFLIGDPASVEARMTTFGEAHTEASEFGAGQGEVAGTPPPTETVWLVRLTGIGVPPAPPPAQPSERCLELIVIIRTQPLEDILVSGRASDAC